MQVLKNIAFGMVKSVLFVFFCCFIFNIGLNYWNTVNVGYDDYVFVRGFENYGVETTARCIRETDVFIYQYIVDGEKYSLSSDLKYVDSVDKTIKIYYDILEPEKAIEQYRLNEIDTFYSDSLKGLANCYLKFVGLVFLYSLLWYLIDRIKYNKILWKDMV